MRLLAFAASLRNESLNHQLVALACEIARREGADVDLARFSEFEMPLYDGDLDRASGLPAGALELKRRVEAAQALLIAAPEYNYSIAGPLKNAIDWVSRARPMPWRGRSVYLLSASPSPMGGIRGLWQTRIPLEGCGALVFPDMFALAHAGEAFDADGRLRDVGLAGRLEREIAGFVRLAETLAPICSVAATRETKARQEKIVPALEDESHIQPPAR
ncbi:NADPH-dependent FMN reductase [Anaeromyxobacter sp. SG26]|uniref:NADPH-dependent FMN reductase n=1 Tax=Anaeromyxobacter sp. SG26 TaxID=2925407 RepID=UPI001F5AE958|nr:NAD(P)H-dependent oxidoreductase [Anaeromyxobacter sp. SG26]